MVDQPELAAPAAKPPGMDPAEKKLKICDLIVRGVIGTLVTVLIAVIGFRMEANRAKLAQKEEANRVMLAESNKAEMALRESSVKQKELDVNLGLKIFDNLLTHYLQPGPKQESGIGNRQKILLLRLISLNFQDSPLNLRPLFEQLDSQLTDPKEKADLRQIALEVARRQAFRLTFPNDWDSGPLPVKQGEQISLPSVPAKIIVDAVKNDRIQISLLSTYTEAGRSLGPFDINYFDMPIIDNTKLGDKRVAVMRLEDEGTNPRIRIITFPSYLAADRFDIKEMTQDIRASDFGTQYLQEPNKEKP
jgi:hypothetical protein